LDGFDFEDLEGAEVEVDLARVFDLNFSNSFLNIEGK
jgi:hypothetical protein